MPNRIEPLASIVGVGVRYAVSFRSLEPEFKHAGAVAVLQDVGVKACEDGAEEGFGEATVGEDGEGAEVGGLEVSAGGLDGGEDLVGC